MNVGFEEEPVAVAAQRSGVGPDQLGAGFVVTGAGPQFQQGVGRGGGEGSLVLVGCRLPARPLDQRVNLDRCGAVVCSEADQTEPVQGSNGIAGIVAVDGPSQSSPV